MIFRGKDKWEWCAAFEGSAILEGHLNVKRRASAILFDRWEVL